MNLKPLILTLPLFLTGCVKIYSSGYSENINTSTFFLPKLESFMYCGNTFFASSSFIDRLNTRNPNLPGKVVAITSLQDIDGSEFNASVRAPMKCKAALTFADNHKETGVMNVSLLNGSMPMFDTETSLAKYLDIKWISDKQITEQKKRLIELDEEINKTFAHPSYQCIYLSVSSDGDLSHTTSIVSNPAACGNNPSRKYYPGLEDLLEEQIDLQNKIKITKQG